MSKFKVGDKVVRTAWDANYLMQGKPYCVVTEVDGEYIATDGNTDGCIWSDDHFELYQEPAQKTFNPKPGDIIVTESEGNWVCCTVKEVNKLKNNSFYTSEPIVGYQRRDSGYIRHQDWDKYGNADGFSEFSIKEIIPASSNNPVAIPQQPQDLSFQVKALELENQMLRMLLRQKGVDV